MAEDRFIEVGRVAGSHGVSGKVRVAPYSGDPGGVAAVRRVRFTLPGGPEGPKEEEFPVLSAQRSGGCAVFLLEGIATPEGAAAWRGAKVSVRRSDLPPPGEDEYYGFDLVGCEAVDAEGNPVGTVTGVTCGPAHDWLEIRRPEGEEGLLPMISEFVREVDVEGKRIVVSPPPGW